MKNYPLSLLKELYFVLACTCMIASCSDLEVDPNGDSLTEIRLTSGIELQSKAAYPQTDIQLAEGEPVYVWVDRNIAGYPELYGQPMVADGAGNLAGEYKMYFPMNGDNVNIYALHTNAYFPDSDFPTATFTHSVQTVQTTLEQYVDSDLLYARSKDIAKTENAVPLRFYHQLSKLQVAIVAKDGIQQSDIAEVTVNGTKVLANVTLSKDMSANGLTVMPAGPVSAISIGMDLSADFSDGNVIYNDVIVVPQTITSGTVFLGITLKGGTNITYKLDSDVTFESGKKYILQMTVDLKSIELNTVVSDWLDGDPIIGNNGTVRYIVHYTDNSAERIYTDGGNTIAFNGSGKTVRSIELPDYGKTYLIGRKDITEITLNLDEDGDLNFRPSVDGYIPIGSYAEMQLINTLDGAMSGYYRQEDDIDLMNESWIPIGDENNPFSGVFDGNGFGISRINVSGHEYAGLFGCLRGNQALLEDIDLVSGIVEGTVYAAGLCAYNNGGIIDGCTNNAVVRSNQSINDTFSGGIVAYNEQGSVKNSGNAGNVSSSTSYNNNPCSGGIIGCIELNGEVTACYNAGNVSSSTSYSNSSYSGGIIGYIEQNGEVTACYNAGNVSSPSSSSSYSGGIIASVYRNGEMTACYNTGRIVSGYYACGILSANSNSSAIIRSCYWLEGMSEDGGVRGGDQEDVQSFTGSFTPDAETHPEWGIGNGETNGWWKNYNGNNNLPQLWWE